MQSLIHNIAVLKKITGHGGGGEEAAHELPNLITILNSYFFGGTSVGDFLHHWENAIFSLIIVAIIAIVARMAYRNPQLVPRRLQSAVELIIEALENFIVGVIGPHGRKFVPFLGTLFLYIFCSNLAGLVPFMKSPTANVNQTIALAVCVFLYVQFTAVKENGPVGFLKHLMGDARTPVEWAIVPLMLPIHIIGEFAKPMSLSLRLFGNVTGEDILILIFVGLGAGMLAFTNLPIGVPLQLPFIFLAILTSFIQALVFMLLSTVYFAMVLPHGEEDH